LSNIIIVGDSFCASAGAWPAELADALDLTLISHGQGGQSWWNARKFINSINPAVIAQTEVMVFVHTNSDRIPTYNEQIGLINHSADPTTEIDHAVQLYFKYIHDNDFLTWAQRAWFLEINQRWADKKIVHLHSFPWSLDNGDLLSGLNVTTNLCSISLNELGAERLELFADTRSNHLNAHNNSQLAQQLAELIQHYKQQKVSLNTDLFDLTTTRWFNWR